jgi:hypothetical protein
MLTKLVTDIFDLGLFGFGLNSFGSVLRSSVNMPTPIYSWHMVL